MRLTGTSFDHHRRRQGIGRATALKFAKEGAQVVVCDINLEAVQQTVELVKSSWRRGRGVPRRRDGQGQHRRAWSTA